MTQSEKSNGKKILIVGGGIGGLATANSLAKQGFNVHVMEQADDFREVGAGIQLAPNGIRALTELGLREEVFNCVWRPNAIVMRDAKDGHDIVRIDVGEEFLKRFDNPYMVIHRADLLDVLLQACKKDGRISLQTNARVVGFEQNGEQVQVKLEDGQTHTGHALIGADGLRSKIREAIVNDGAPPLPKYVVYRGVIEREKLPNDLWESEVVMWTGPDADFVHYPVRRGELFNLVVTFKAQEALDPHDISGSRSEMVAPYADFHAKVHRLLDLLPAQRRWTVTDRDPVKNWSQGRVTLLGDAAHPMLQYMAQGACQALEDAAELVKQVAQNPDNLEAAFEDYAEQRYLRTARVQFSAREMIEVCQVKGVLAELREQYFGRRSDQQLYDGLAWLYSAKPTEMFK